MPARCHSSQSVFKSGPCAAAIVLVLFSAAAAVTAHGGPKGTGDKEACVAAFAKGQELEKAGKLVESRAELVTCGRDVCPDVVRRDCLQVLQSVEASTPSIVPGARDAAGNDVVDARLSLDGAVLATKLDGSAIPVNPGPHALRFEKAGAAPVERQVVVRVGEKNRVVTVDFAANKPAATAPEPSGTAAPPGVSTAAPASPETPARPTPIGPLVLGALGLVSIGAFAALGVKGKDDLAGLRATCGETHSCEPADVDAVKAELIAADVSLGVGVLALGAATIWLVASYRGEPPKKAAGLTVLPVAAAVPSGAALGIVGRF
jgi:hypothetical protein